MQTTLAFKCPQTGEVVRPRAGACPACGAPGMRGHLRLVGKNWVADPEAPMEAMPVPAHREKRGIMTEDLLRRWRISRPWLKTRENILLASGWTRAGLYRVNRPLGHSYVWGVAWSLWWTVAGISPALADGGAIHFIVHEPNGRIHFMVARPR